MCKMNTLYLLPKARKTSFANSIEAWVPQFWANESMAILVENMQMAGLVHRDFENIISEAGDTVNTRKPGEFVAYNKANGDDITVQDVTATNIAVVLNQHLHVSFLIKDREQARSFQDLTNEYLRPALIAIARRIDLMLLGQAPRFLRTDGKTAGTLGTNASVASILETRKLLNINKTDMVGRNLVITPKDEAALLALDVFINADKVGDDGTSLREASLGRRLGFNVYMCQNVCNVTGATDVNIAFLVNTAGALAGATTIPLKTGTGALTTGEWITIAGDMIPHYIVSHVENTAGNTTSIVISPPLKTAVVVNAIVTVMTYGQINQSATTVVAGGSASISGYIAGWEKPLVYDTFTLDPQVGQFVTFAAAGDVYTIVSVNTSAKTIQLDRPLVTLLADNQKIFLGPVGAYNFAFVKNAIALVTRPMAIPRAGSGAVGATANYANMSVRVVWAYDPYKQGLIVTVDVLCGVALLEQLNGEVMLG